AIYDNIKKFVNYLLSSNLGEVLILFLAMVFGFAVDGVTIIPLLAVHLLWINLVTDGLPALALGADPADPRVMSRKPRDPGVPLLSKNLSLMMVFSSLVLAAAALWVFVHYLPNVALAQTMAFSMVVVFEMARIFMIHAQYRSPFFSNKGLLWAVAGSLALQVLVLYIPFLQKALKVVPLGMVAWGQLLLLAVVSYVVVVGVQKLIVKMTGQFD
ncbi:MAG TPA: cation transporting ATPase C-terminal domain-containing protein, partial [Candidatus Nanoarchaeia archaeon]|nr:cation transporting ATPase C-terminal domain-containing protein [Candidatus Nanoarchaeia archaeon]